MLSERTRGLAPSVRGAITEEEMKRESGTQLFILAVHVNHKKRLIIAHFLFYLIF